MPTKQPCAQYKYVVTPSGPKIVAVPDQESKDEESPADYNTGGYLPVKVGDVFKEERYTVVRKLG
jgi:serine/threonine-protein kinase SRPK3